MIKDNEGSASPSNSRSFSANTRKISSKVNRPATPHINLFSADKNDQNDQRLNQTYRDGYNLNSGSALHTPEDVSIRTLKRGNENEIIFKNFSSFMKQIIETKNENFLSGDVRVIEYIISKYLNIPINEVNSLEKLSIRINTDFGLLNQFGEYLPNLRELKLNNSVLTGISEIGTNFRNLKILQVCNCNMKDLSGIICYSSLEVLEASDNQICDLIELEMCSSIKRLNLKNNLIADEENLQFLSNMTELKWLNLNGNPIQKSPNYLELIKENLPSLEVMDDDSDGSYLFISEGKINSDSNVCDNTNQSVSISTSTFTTCSSPEIENQTNTRKLVTQSNNFNRANRFDAVYDINTAEDKERENIPSNTEEKSPNEPWKFPGNNKYDFSVSTNNTSLNKSLHVRGKSQCQANNNNPLTKPKKNTGLKFNAPISTNTTTLKPVIVKKEAPLEMRSFKKSIDEELVNEAHEIIKNIDKGRMGNSKGFIPGVTSKFNDTDKLKIKENPGLSLKNSLLLGSKELKPMKLRVKQEVADISGSSQTHR